MKKYGRHYLRRGLSVLLAVVMTCAAAQSLVYAVELAENDTVTPDWNEGTARARYTTSGTLEISFPEADVQNGDGTGVEYYADFYDLDNVSGEDYSGRETPVNDTPYQLSISGQTLAEGDATQLLSASLTAEQIDALNLDMSHRISIAITAVKGNWRSEAIEALVGESIDVPAENNEPDSEVKFSTFANFNVGDDTKYDAGEYPNSDLNSWTYNGKNYSNNDNDAFNSDPAAPNGVFGGTGTDPEAQFKYQAPGFDASNAFRMYVQGQSDAEQTLEIMYNQDHWQFTNAEELWIWVDTSYVEFDEFAVQVRYMDKGGALNIWGKRDSRSAYDLLRTDYSPESKISEDVYSTVGYSSITGEPAKVYRLNEDGLWEAVYTNNEGYLTNFGHYRGFLRVPVENLYNENYDAVTNPYQALTDERPFTELSIFGFDENDYEVGEWETNVDGMYDDAENWGQLTASTLFEEYFHQNNGQYIEWYYDNQYDNDQEQRRLDSVGNDKLTTEDIQGIMQALKDRMNSNCTSGSTFFSVIPINDISTVGIRWKGTSDDSLNKPFYIDQIGFSGQNLITNDSNQGTSGTLESINMIQDTATVVSDLFASYFPIPTAVNPSDYGLLNDFVELCGQLGLATSNVEGLETALNSLNEILAGRDVVQYLSTTLNDITTPSGNEDTIVTLYNLYLTFTLGQIQELGVNDEAKLIQLYNDANRNIWYPSAIGNMGWLSFNDLEENYTIGQTALHQYDDYTPSLDGDNNNYDTGHVLDWNALDSVNPRGAWENRENFVAYSRSVYNDNANYNNQRFGYGVSTIGLNGFENTVSVDTNIYRAVLNDTETYRISLTANGQDDPTSWDNINGVNAAGANYITFYADFTQMSDISKLWVAVRSGNGAIFSSESATQVDVLDYDNPSNGWQPKNYSQLNGIRGFVRIPVSSLISLSGTLDWNDVRQIKVFLNGISNNESAAGSFFALDMFGFLYNTVDATHPAFGSLSESLETPDPIDNATDQFGTALGQLFVEVTDPEEGNIKLFDRDATLEDGASAYDSLIAAYHTMTLSEKERADDLIKSTSGNKFADVEDLERFVRNYERGRWENIGQLQANADTAITQRELVEEAFTAGTAVGNVDDIDAIFAMYEERYPDYYKYAVQTYWPDRNLHAVFPNYNPEDVTEVEETGVKITYNEASDMYVGTFTLNYTGAVSPTNGMSFTYNPSVTLTADDDSGATIAVVPKVVNAAVGNSQNSYDQTLTITFEVDPTSIKHGGTYTGELKLSVNVDPDTNNPNVDKPDQYRQTITIPVTLVSEATFTVTIPADTTVDWGANKKEMSRYAVEDDLFLPNGASLTLDITSGESNDFKMVNGDKAIAYTLKNGDDVFHTIADVTAPDEYNLSVNVADDQWTQGGLVQGTYQDTLTFTVKYNEDTA